MITIREIADLAGVSRGTVDRVINRRGGVSPAIEHRVATIINQYGYKPNKAARALVKSRKTYAIGVISATVENIFFKDVLEGIQYATREFADSGFSVRHREVAKFSVKDQLDCIDALLEEGVDGLAINPINDDKIREKLAAATRRGIPVITFNSDIEGVDRLAYIGCDYRKTGRIALGLLALATRERANVAIVTGSMKSLGHWQRVKGVRDELRNFPRMRLVDVVENFDDDIASYARVRELLEKEKEIDAFYFSTAGKEGGIRAILETRPRKQPKIVTVDLDDFTRQCLVDGTVVATVCQQPFIQGYEPLRQLANYLTFRDKPEPIQYTQTEIVIKQTINDP